MNFRQTDTLTVPVSEASFSPGTRYRLAAIRVALGLRGRVPSMLKAAPAIRSVATCEEIVRRHPEIGSGVRWTLERRIRSWRAIH